MPVAKKSKIKEEQPKFLYGRFQFEDQFRMAIIKIGTKLLHIVYLDDNFVRIHTEPLNELRYLKEMANSEENLSEMKKRARQFRKRSPLTGLKREITMKAKGVLEEIEALPVPAKRV